jgi:hypothetical protein
MNLQHPQSTHAVPTNPAEESERQPSSGGPDDTAEPEGQFPESRKDDPTPDPDASHEGGTEEEIGDRTGPGAGYDQEPEQEPDGGGVA